MTKSRYKILCLLAVALCMAACDKARVFDENKDIPNQQWYYKNHVLFDVNIDDTTKLYNIYVNLRISSEYKYCNLFMMLHQTNPGKQVSKERKEFTLADETGRWLGRGLGDLYDYQVPVYQNSRFREKGIYRFELEQNMRNDTLMYVKAAGIRIEDAALAAEKQ